MANESTCIFCDGRDRPLFIVAGGGGDFREDHLIFEITKGGIAENFGSIQRRGPLKFAWKMKTWRGRDRERHQKLWGEGHFSEVTFKGGIC